MGIYVEIPIRAPMDAVWRHTQEPTLHERWDLRFSTISYLTGKPGEAQQFEYTTQIGFGIRVAGKGETVAARAMAGDCRVSSLKFHSDDRLSIIREGSGYWKYIPTADGVRFLTWYDYRTRFGRAGAVFDRYAFRPLLAWATAWSFDRLRLWLERGISPSVALRQFITRACARGSVGLVFAYHGLVPKLLRRDGDELAMLKDAGVPSSWLLTALFSAGSAELVVALLLLWYWRSRWPSLAVLMLMLATTVGVAVASPRYLAAAFNPVSLNLGVAALSFVDLVNFTDTPSAARCRRSARADKT